MPPLRALRQLQAPLPHRELPLLLQTPRVLQKLATSQPAKATRSST
jgi:hypothetical protein